jgi:hypothetical protein
MFKVNSTARLKATRVHADTTPQVIENIIRLLESKGMDVDEVRGDAKVGKLEINGRASQILSILKSSGLRYLGLGVYNTHIFSYNKTPSKLAHVQFNPKDCTLEFDR